VERAGQGPLSERLGLARAVPAVVVRPWLWPTALMQLLVLAPTGWWRRAPHLPVPDRDYFRFRMQTMYGDASHRPEGEDLVTYLNWCRRYR
jgi:hypothetical protein